MDKILRELNLGTLADRFDAEKIEPDNVISASDSELTRLGVPTIGDRIHNYFSVIIDCPSIGRCQLTIRNRLPSIDRLIFRSSISIDW